MQNPAPAQNIHDYAALSPDTVIDAVEATGRLSDARVLALNSYENRVYQVGLEDASPVIVKFYRPQRWSDAQIREEHAFCLELAAAELPVVAPLAREDGETLFLHAGFRYALFPRKGGQAPEPGNLEQLQRLGTLLGRIHAVARSRPFVHRVALDLARYLERPSRLLRERGFVPPAFAARYAALIDGLRTDIAPLFAAGFTPLRTQGDCHPGNIVWTRDEGPWFVDFDDCQTAPAVQDLWMLLAGDRRERELALAEMLDGYEAFCDFDTRELRLIEALRALRLVQHAGWIAERWDDPAFPRAFPWFNTPRWWQSHLAELDEQRQMLAEEPLRRL
ncbi:MAG: serine/threonine protein kinase [Pseudomonadota bacterium]